MTILVTGSSGFIGTNFLNFLKKKKKKFCAVDKKLNRYINFKEFVKLDLLQFEKVDSLIKKKKIKYIFHFAAIPGFVKCHNNPQDAFNNNVNATLNLIILSKKYKVKRLVIASSMGVNNFYINPSIYGLTKFICEQAAITFCKNFNQRISILKISNVFGPYSLHKSSVVHEFLKAIIKNKKLKIHKNGKQKRDFIYVEDLCEKIFDQIFKKPYKQNIQINTKKFISILDLKNQLDIISKKNNNHIFTKTPTGYDDKDYKMPSMLINSSFIKKLENTYIWYNKFLKKK